MKPAKLIALLLLLLIGNVLHVKAQPPYISNFTPVSGPVGSNVVITGINFSPVAAQNKVFFGAVQATVTSATSTTLNVVVPHGANYEPITVNTNGLVVASRNAFIVTYPNGGTIYSTSFHDQISFEAGDLIHEVVACDIDLDGKPDILTANNQNNGGASSFSVLRNTTTGDSITFADHIDFSNGVQTYSIACGDLDGDGKPDVVASSIGNSGISIYKNTSTPGNISFAAAINYNGADAPCAVAIADFDWDGKQDIVVANSVLSASISIYRNTTVAGNISFAPKIDFTTQLSPQYIAARDFNGDGRIDIVVTNKLSSSFSVFRNTSSAGNINFAPRADVGVGSGFQPVGLDVTDISGDGKPDLIVMISATSSGDVTYAQTYKNTSGTSSVSFALKGTSASSTFATGSHANSGDINGDGKPDFAVGIPSLDRIKVYQNFYDPVTDGFYFNSPIEFYSFSAFFIAICDLNADSKPEIISHFLGSNTVRVLRNKCGEPGIVNFSPVTGSTGTLVTINGHNLANITAVSFGGVPASSFTIVNDNQITATVAVGATGDVVITGSNGTASLGTFGYFPGPTITGFTPTQAGAGTTITINGTNLDNVSAVSFGGVAATGFTAISSTELTAVVAAGASGNVSVTTPGGTAILPGFEFIPAPQITSFTPTSALSGAVITITGNNFNNATSVTFGGTAAASFNVINSTTIEAVVGAGSSGAVRVITAGGSASLGGFTYIPFPTPEITSFTPFSAIPGTVMTINGNNFVADTAQNIVYIGGVRAQLINATTNQLTAIIPSGSFLEKVSVTTNNLTAISGRNFIPTFNSNQVLNSNSFATPQLFTTTSSSGQIGLADLDIDGKLDIITNNSILRNTSTLSNFSFGPEYFLNNGNHFHPVDLNGDGKKDLFAISMYGAHTYAWNNNSTPGNLQLTLVTFADAGGGVYSVADADFNNDGKIDIVLGVVGKICILKNIGTGTNIYFDNPLLINTGSKNLVATADFDGDGKTDIAMLNSLGFSVSIYRNISTGSNINFEFSQSYPTKADVTDQGGPEDILVRDFNGDGLPDIAIANTQASQTISVFKNSSINGNIQFDPRTDIAVAGFSSFKLGASDLDGDAKPDMIATHYGEVIAKTAVLKNTSNSSISFAALIPYNYSSSNTNIGINAADLNHDNKPEIIVRNNNKILVYKNQQPENSDPQSCIGQPLQLTTNLTGNTYQWQEDTGTGFVDIQNDAIYSGVNTSVLQFANISSQYGRKYRCLVDGFYSAEMKLKLVNRFVGAQSLLWDNPANWSCSVVPDENTDVILDLGSSIANINISVASISISNYAYLLVNPGIQLTITH